MTRIPIEGKKGKLAVVHIAKKATGIAEDAYRILLEGAAGIGSSAELEYEDQFASVMAAFQTLGFRQNVLRPKRAEPAGQRNPEHISARQEYYIKGLWRLASRAKSEQSLRAMVKRIAKVDDVRFLGRRHAQKVILALRDIAWKAGYDPDTGAEVGTGTTGKSVSADGG